jgi:hypothetical protein
MKSYRPQQVRCKHLGFRCRNGVLLGSVLGRDAFFVVDLAANGEAFGADGCGRACDQMIDIGAVFSAEAAGRILLVGGNESERVVGWFGGGFSREPGRFSGAAVADEYLGTGDQVGHVGAVACAKGAGAGDAGDPFADVGVVDTKVGEDLGGNSIAFSQDSEQQVLAAGVVRAENLVHVMRPGDIR